MAKFQDYPLLALRGRVVFPDTTVNFDVGRMISLTAVKYAADNGTNIFVCTQKQSEKEEITAEDVFMSGTVVKLRQITRLPGNNLRLSVEGLFRATVRQLRKENGAFIATVEEITPVRGDPALEEAYFRTSKGNNLVRQPFYKGRVVGAGQVFRPRQVCQPRGSLYAD